MSLRYHGREYGYVDSSDREELDAIAREQETRARVARISWRFWRMGPVTDAEARALMQARQGRDRLAERAERRRRGLRP